MLSRLCPMYLRIDADGSIRELGPTAAKILGPDVVNRTIFDLLECHRPADVSDAVSLFAAAGEKLQFRVRARPTTILVGHLIPETSGSALVNLGLGYAVERAVQDHALVSTDFAPTDPSVEMLFLVEANAVALQASRTLNTRLRVAQLTAQEEAFTDTLTGLSNRRAFDHIAQRVAMSKRSFSLMQIDLDLFKAVNDTHGHAAGDAVLRRVGSVLSSAVRENDLAARIGGDEFVLLFPDLTIRDRLTALAARLIRLIENPVEFEGKRCRVSASIGIACWSGGSQADVPALMDAADAALYTAKRSGRGKAVMSEEIDAHAFAETSSTRFRTIENTES